ncbi:acyl-CoA synthetase (AMP-forming)/AMP-acid ligase II [Xenococcus sp. PCC 7305]|uniref:AMP-binding protein n=1 Tax=Xenococcus sp. PCC 7305 TaxID=102125 RepID=UPI0002AC234E|nr:AMP-binding protein [Xenococcus sp. PCC 7305]ELS02523.1 acyl-CoA synthetase (AMP-forming)/AMP-acid ligase II [Xenococcus sp. PCC 7305]
MKELKLHPGNYPDDWQPVLLHQFLLQYAQISPDAIAIISAKGQWSYQDLSHYSYLYADILDNCGLAHGDRVVLELEPSPQAVALFAACSLLGLVFVPVSPENPPERGEKILEITEAKLHIRAISQEKNIDKLHQRLQGFLEGNVLNIKGRLPKEVRSRKSSVIESDLAYIIFTSGTTGIPKGIMMTHRAALVFFRALVNYCKLNSSARLGTIAPLQFDFSLLDISLTLGSGATLVKIPRQLSLMPQKFLRYLDRYQVTQLNCVPSIWKVLLSYAAKDIAKLQHLHSTLFAGEPFAIADILTLQSLLPQLRMINCFGQSESIACSFSEVPNPLSPDTKNLSIGFAHPGAEMLLLDEQKQEIKQPDQVGEIYLRGANLFSGYWRNPEATKKALIPNPLNSLSGEKVFRTGDLAYKGSQGELYLVGRRDLQVKIMGNRVELAEIEGKLRAYPDINQVCAIAINRQGNIRLAAFLSVEKNKTVPSAQEVRFFCKDLPHYMIPSEIYFVDNLPQTINGKIDRKALADSSE